MTEVQNYRHDGINNLFDQAFATALKHAPKATGFRPAASAPVFHAYERHGLFHRPR